ncbi:hypothetical protein CYMTET_15957 [Cymbomonas tetramitiformis]|uniref:PDZ domain-containing protein n=1 Tax=Cymbomonas tetramitiformis TaxID=36881 RepID=A0AAE0L8S0_9CHLO|nr:hypothetical protein CYMTET_15957 [Cymbomonas tetramitiformis]
MKEVTQTVIVSVIVIEILISFAPKSLDGRQSACFPGLDINEPPDDSTRESLKALERLTDGNFEIASGVEENKADHSDEKLEDELTVAEVSLPDSTSFGFQERELPPTASFTKIYSNSELFAVELEIPVGAVLEEKEEDGFVVVEEVSEGGSAEAAGLQRGDILRAVSACVATMKYPTGNILLGGIGRPGFKRALVTLQVGEESDGQQFGKTLAAIGTHAKAERDLILVIERSSC